MTDHTDDNLDRIDKALENLALEDAPDHLVQSTLERVRATPFSEPIRHRSRTWANGLAAAVVAVAAVGIIYQQLPIYREPESPLIADDTVLVSSKTDEELVQFAFKRVDALREAGNRPEAASETERAFDGARYREQDRQEHAEGYATRNFDSSQRALSPRKDAMGKSVGEISSVSDDARANEIGAFRYESKKLSAAVDRPVVQQGDFDASFDDNFALENLNSRELLLLEPSTSVLPNSHQKAVAAQSPARDSFVARYRNMDGLSYQQASGYWANTYVPGDPAMRRLEAELRSHNPQALKTTLERNIQPFDAPENAALGVYLHGTQTAVDGPSRVQLQVGLKAAERQGGQRPPMNIAVVLDLPEKVDVSVAHQIRALLMALNEQRQTGDRFSITTAGVPGGTVVQPDDYRHGTVVSFIDHLASGQLQGDTLDLVGAFISAVDRLAADDDPTAVLGSSLVVLVTADGIGPQTRDGIETLAHSSAIAGMPVSVVTLAGVSGSGIESIVLAGQGRLRALATPAAAAQLIDRELHSASRTVARAVRLRIQLKPGVRLVDVMGSYRLDERDAARVRQAEQSIDARLSRTWGIQTDRGEDEDGIQIVIPGIAAGESHVVLLDVVVDGPGPVADVQVRYKDLIAMSNGVVRTSLSLADADSTRRAYGPLEHNVFKNLLALKLSEAARLGSRYLADGDASAARAELVNALTLIIGLRASAPGWESDPELEADAQRLSRFVRELDAGHTDMLVTELAYAAYRKLLPAQTHEDERR